MGDVERLRDRILVIDHGRLAYDGDLPGLSRTVGAERVLVVDLAQPVPDLTGLDGARHLASEAGEPLTGQGNSTHARTRKFKGAGMAKELVA